MVMRMMAVHQADVHRLLGGDAAGGPRAAVAGAGFLHSAAAALEDEGWSFGSSGRGEGAACFREEAAEALARRTEELLQALRTQDDAAIRNRYKDADLRDQCQLCHRHGGGEDC